MVKKIAYIFVITVTLGSFAVWFVRSESELDLTAQQTSELDELIKGQLRQELSSNAELIKLDGPSRIEGGHRRSGFFTYRLTNDGRESKLIVWWHLEDNRVILDKIDR